MDSTTTDIRSISAYGPARSSVSGSPLEPQELQRMQRYWNATLYLSAGMIYLRDNPLLREPLKPEHVKRRLLGHWGSDPGMSLVYIHLNRLIKKYDLDVIFLAGPGHGAPALISNVYLEGAYSEIYSEVSEDADGMRRRHRRTCARRSTTQTNEQLLSRGTSRSAKAERDALAMYNLAHGSPREQAQAIRELGL